MREDPELVSDIKGQLQGWVQDAETVFFGEEKHEGNLIDIC